jgi:hypothetical protein
MGTSWCERDPSLPAPLRARQLQKSGELVHHVPLVPSRSTGRSSQAPVRRAPVDTAIRLRPLAPGPWRRMSSRWTL